MQKENPPTTGMWRRVESKTRGSVSARITAPTPGGQAEFMPAPDESPAARPTAEVVEV